MVAADRFQLHRRVRDLALGVAGQGLSGGHGLRVGAGRLARSRLRRGLGAGDRGNVDVEGRRRALLAGGGAAAGFGTGRGGRLALGRQRRDGQGAGRVGGLGDGGRRLLAGLVAPRAAALMGVVVVVIPLGEATLLGQEGLAVGDRDLPVVGMDLAEGEEPVAVAAELDEAGLERGFYPRDLGEVDVALDLLLGARLEVVFLKTVAADDDDPGLFRVGRVDEHLLCHGWNVSAMGVAERRHGGRRSRVARCSVSFSRRPAGWRQPLDRCRRTAHPGTWSSRYARRPPARGQAWSLTRGSMRSNSRMRSFCVVVHVRDAALRGAAGIVGAPGGARGVDASGREGP